MKRMTAAAMTGLTALVLTGSGTGMALAYDHPSPHADRTPAVTAPVRDPQLAPRTTAPARVHKATSAQHHQATVHVRAPHHAVTASRPATTPQQRHEAVHPVTQHRVGTSRPAVQRHHVTVPQRLTTPARVAPPRIHHTEPARSSNPPRYCDDGEHRDGFDHH